MPAAGDLDLMQPFIKMYMNILPLCKYRAQQYFNHAGAYFPECIYLWGSVFSKTWGELPLEKRAEPLQDSPWHKYEWVSGLEMSAMMYEYFLYTQDKEFLREKLLPLAGAILIFYDQHYGLDEQGMLEIYPSQALETWWDCTNPLPEVAGLYYLTQELKKIPADYVTAAFRELLDNIQNKLPAIPLRELEQKRMLAPAQRYDNKRNIENPELYAVYPFKLYGLGRPDIELAINALIHRWDKGHFGWRQDDLFMALLGLTREARSGLVERCNNWDSRHRFPAFWGPNYDWTPDQDHGGVLTKTLQVMLLQCDDKKIHLLPAWPKEWDVDFKLHAPYNTVVEGKVRDGKIETLHVQPEGRKNDIVIGS
jgi:hypothetical protein